MLHQEADAVGQAIQALYAAALEPALWPHAIAGLTQLADGTVYHQHLVNISDADARLYLDHYVTIDPRLQLLEQRPQRWLSDNDTFDTAFRSGHPFYVGYFQPRGVGESLFSRFAVEGPRNATIALSRCTHKSRADEPLRDSLDTLLPHMDRAVRITRRFTQLGTEISLAKTVLDRVEEPLCCIDDRGRLMQTNAAFAEKLRKGDIVSESAGTLHFSSPGAHAEFLRALRACNMIALGARSEDREARLTFTVNGSDNSTAHVTVVPLLAVPTQSRSGNACTLVRIDDFHSTPTAERLQQLLGITAAEARLVSRLFAGGSLGSIAKELNISPNTAKTHLASVFFKTGTKRQRELITLVSALLNRNRS
jgi:DNA-binding CsgD family transcriptional regulator